MAAALGKKVIVLVDMDCFYVQVEKKLRPQLHGHPCAIVQYKKWRGGSIIAVDYEARKYGVSRNMKGDDAKEKCPNITLVSVPEKRGKADLTNYRKASTDVMKVLSKFTPIIERASIDEAYLDLTDQVKEYLSKDFNNDEDIAKSLSISTTFIAGYNENESTHDNDCVDGETSTSRDNGTMTWLMEEGRTIERMLAVGGLLTQHIRAAILEQLGFTCSAGISYNKMLAKLAAGMNKPNKQTIIPKSSISVVFESTPFKKVRHLGGKLGTQIQQQLGIELVGQLQHYSLQVLKSKFGDRTGAWLHDLCRGNCSEEIKIRTIPKSIGCGKNFTGPEKLTKKDEIKYWLEQLTGELVERLREDMIENSRKAQSLSVHFLLEGMKSGLSRSFPLLSYDEEYIVSHSWEAINKCHHTVLSESRTTLTWTSGVLNIHLSASKFVNSIESQSLMSFLCTDTKCQEQYQRDDIKGSTSLSIPTKRKLSEDFVSFPQCSPDSQSLDIFDNPFSCTVCAVCGESVLMFLLDEHMDYHVAIDDIK